MSEHEKVLKKKRQYARLKRELLAKESKAEESEQIERQRKKAIKVQREVLRLRLRAQAKREPGPGTLPDFVIIGAAKAGTTFFYHLLTQHPHVEPAAFKELHFFDYFFDEGIEAYRRCFPQPRWKDGRKTITGEATPGYLFHRPVEERMAQVIPQARLIALLRNPVDLLYSAHQHQVRKGQKGRTFEEIIEARLRGPHPGALSRGVYVDHLLCWSRFFSEEQMLVLKSEDFFERPKEILGRTLRFLDLPDWEPDASEMQGKRNKGSYEQPMDPGVRQRLDDYFKPHNQRLYEYLGVDFGW